MSTTGRVPQRSLSAPQPKPAAPITRKLSVMALDTLALDPEVVSDTAGILFKQREDVAALTPELAAELLKPEPEPA